MWVHLEKKYIHDKSHDPDGHRMADTAKKPNFLIFWGGIFEHILQKKQKKQIARSVQKCKIFRPFFANFEQFFWALELGWYTF